MSWIGYANVVMNAKYVQCECGQVLAVPPKTPKVRCPKCGVVLRADAGGGPRRGPDRGRSPGSPAPDSMDEEDGGDQYRISSEASSDAGQPVEASSGTWVSHVPIPASSAGTEGPSTGGGRRRNASATASESAGSVDLPGPFFAWSALVYPLIAPNWMRWLGLSLVTTLTTLVVAGVVFIVLVLAKFGVLSFFAVATAATGCLALVSYVVACFVTVVEETANGEDRLYRLPGMSWWETLPPFLRAAGAAGVAVAVAYGVTYPLRRWLLWPDDWVAVIRAIVVFQLFPILLITNLVDQSVLPISSLFTTLGRLAGRAGHFAVFLLLTATATVGTAAGLEALYDLGIGATLAGSGPLIAAWLMFYGHWLGRLVRQLSVED